MNYKFAICCREPLINVTGGIGTYTRLLVELISKRHGDCVIFIPNELNEAEDIKKLIPTIEVVSVKLLENFPNNIHSEALKWSYSLYKSIELFEKCNRISLFEFPDYEAEGYYAINAAKYGLLKFKSCVRLHSPIFMLKTDNNNDLMYLSDERIIAAEKSCLMLCDVILYGADKMQARVFSYFDENQKEKLMQKSVKIHHPSAQKKIRKKILNNNINSINVATIGRLEWRKGQDIVVHGSARIKNLDNFKITFYGGDTNTAPDGGSYSNYLKEMALKCNNNLINIAGKLPQNELWDKLGEEVDAFIFPSRFENYPNALLEVIELGLPIAVSANGGMPEILQLNGYENWIEFFPTHEGVEKAINWIIENSKKNILINSLDCATEINGKIVESYNILINDSTSVSNSIDVISKKSISVVTPHFNQSNLIDELLKSTLQIVSCGIDLELLIVDDGSAANEISNLESKIKNYSYVKIIKSSDGVNVGPAKQRYLGACQAKNEIILFCDADDYVSVDFIVNSLSALNADQSVEYCIAPHKAFGLESYVWMPSPASNITIMWENYTNSGIVIRKNSLRREWFYVDYDASEDWFTSAMILLNLSKYIVYPEIGYFYRRIGRSRSTQNIEFLNSAERLVRYEIIRSCISSGKLNAIQIESIFRRAIFEIPPVSVFNQNYSIKSYLKNFIIKILEFFGLKKFVKYFYKLIFNYLVKF